MAIYGDRSSEIAAELAMHFEQSRDWPRAVQYLVQAAENAMRKSAHHEAADLAQRGLVVLKLVPGSAERDQQEVALRKILILSLMAVKGFAWAGVEEIYADGKDLFRLSKPSPELFNWLYLLGLFHMFRGKIRPALGIADQVAGSCRGTQGSDTDHGSPPRKGFYTFRNGQMQRSARTRGSGFAALFCEPFSPDSDQRS